MSDETTSARSAPQQLCFDDGSRAIKENSPVLYELSATSARDASIPIRDYYEVDRLVQEILALKSAAATSANVVWRNRVALQFPDELLADAPEVCWEFETVLGDESYLVFCLGDTTYQSCCPDQVAAAHLQADCIVHYGHACLSTCNTPVLYSFGRASFSVERAVQAVTHELKKQHTSVSKLVVLYQVKYHTQIPPLEQRLREIGEIDIITGRVPEILNPNRMKPNTNRGCCESDQSCQASSGELDLCCQTSSSESSPCQSMSKQSDVPKSSDDPLEDQSKNTLFLSTGGLQLPTDLGNAPFILLFVGDESSLQFMNIILRFLSSKIPPECYWIWRPKEEQLITEISPQFQRQLNRRFYMVQKAKMASVFGILVANLSDHQMKSVVHSLDRMIQDHDRTSYIFAVGKINPAKLANFGEIDCFILVACPEHSLLENDREFATPIVTPLELSMALGVTQWGELEYSLNAEDYLRHVSTTAANVPAHCEGGGDIEHDDDDAPYFNPVSGQYESFGSTRRSDAEEQQPLNLSALPGQGALTTYNSAAANFLKQREYQGLQVDAGQTEVRVAVAGQQGVASNYNDR